MKRCQWLALAVNHLMSGWSTRALARSWRSPAALVRSWRTLKLASIHLHTSSWLNQSPTRLSSRSLSSLSQDYRRITYLTDVEGDRDYLERYVLQSRVLCFRPNTINYPFDFPYADCIDFVNESDHLVYGGDVWDQGGSDLYVVRQLLSLQARYPSRVHFILGNRDLNKMRMVAELGAVGETEAPRHGGVYWLRGTLRPGDPELGWLSSDPRERLKWMLASTMGSPRAFKHRRWELQQERAAAGVEDEVDDWDVVESYRASCHPVSGEMTRYLSKGCLVLRMGEVWFQHGALPMTKDMLSAPSDETLWENLAPAAPWMPAEEASDLNSIEDWVSAMNTFVADNIRGFCEHGEEHTIWSTTGGYHYAHLPYTDLMQYGMGWTPDGVRNPTVVYSSWSVNGMPRQFFPDASGASRRFVNMTRDFLERTGVRLICSGHQPQGDMPNTIRVDVGSNHSALIMCCDTSYSGDTSWHVISGDKIQRENLGRGVARSGRGMHVVSEVLIEVCPSTGKLLDVYCHGVLSDGTRYETTSLNMDDTGTSDDELVVGQLAPDSWAPERSNSPHEDGRWWVRAAFTDGSFLLTAGEGFKCWNRIVRP